MRTLQRRLVRVAAAAVAVVGWGAVIVGPTGASAAIVTTPVGLSPGDQYRLAFVTSTTRDATAVSIADYNAFVTLAANSQADLLALGATWTAIGSTVTIDARDNTGTNPSSTGFPIFLLDGTTKMADGNSDLWDGSIDFPLNIFEDGSAGSALGVARVTAIGTSFFVITGAGIISKHLGSDFPIIGLADPSFVDFNWITTSFAGGSFNTSRFSFYALSSPLTVAAVPLPGALILFGSGLACLAVLRRRNRSVRPN